MFENSPFIEAIKNLKISAIAPAGAPTQEVIQNLSKLKSLNFSLEYFDPTLSPFHANSDEIRLAALKEALFHPEIDIIWNMRGGYGAAKLIPDLALMPKPSKEKFFIGYSDITSLHIFLSQEWGWKTIHGAVLREIYEEEKDPQNLMKILDIISGNITESIITDLIPLNSLATAAKNITATITGGNLELIRCSIGTSWQLRSSGSILFLEDINIKAYQLDRGLYHLKQAGIFDKVAAIVFGTFDNDDKLVMYSLNEFAKFHEVPMFKSNQIGHESVNSPVIYNAKTHIAANSGGSFNMSMLV